MNLKNIKAIVNSEMPNWELLLLSEIATDPEAIPIVLSLLNNEREQSKQIIVETNSELSRALVTIEDENYGGKKAYIDRAWVVEQIKNHYLKWKDRIKCNFKVEGLP